MNDIKKNFIIAIPGRLESSRLPNKLLFELGGKSIITRVFENCLKAFDKNKIIFCTDSETLSNKAKELEIHSIITKKILSHKVSLLNDPDSISSIQIASVVLKCLKILQTIN